MLSALSDAPPVLDNRVHVTHVGNAPDVVVAIPGGECEVEQGQFDGLSGLGSDQPRTLERPTPRRLSGHAGQVASTGRSTGVG